MKYFFALLLFCAYSTAAQEIQPLSGLTSTIIVIHNGNYYNPSEKSFDTAGGAVNAEPTPVLTRIGNEALFGTLFGAFWMVPGGAIGGALAGTDDPFGRFGPTIVGMFTGYTFGTSLGIYIVAEKDNPELSFWGTLGCGVLGAATGALIVSATQQKTTVLNLAPLVLPLAAPIMYVHFVE